MHFVAANSLLDIDLSAFDEWTINPILQDLTSQIRALRDRFFAVKRYTDKKALRQQDRSLRNDLRQQLIRLATGGNAAKIEYLNNEIAKLQQERTKYLEPNIQEMAPHEDDAELLDFARPDRSDSLRIDVNAVKRGEIDAQIKRCQAALKKELRVDDQAVYDETTKLANWDPFNQMATASFFNPKWMFGHEGRFDIVIGNPPYVRADNPAPDYRKEREAIKASGMYETLWEKWDLFVPFLERGYQMLVNGGVESFIVSDAYCHATYAQRSQEWFLRHARIPRIDFCGDLQIFEAAVHNVIPFFEKADGADSVPLRRLHTERFGNVTELPSDIQRNLTYRAFFPETKPKEVQTSLNGIPLGKICYISFGCRPNSDEKRAKKLFKASDLVSDIQDEMHPKKYIEGKDIHRYTYGRTRWLEWGTERSPSLLARPTFKELYEVPEKIMLADVSGAMNKAAYDNQKVFHSHTLISCVPWKSLCGICNNSLRKSAKYKYEEKSEQKEKPSREEFEEISKHFSVKYIIAVINSSVAGVFLRANRRSNIHLYPDDWKKLPIPEATPEQQRPIIALVDQILAAKQNDPNAGISHLEAQLEYHVNKLYGIIENNEIRSSGEKDDY